MLFWITHKKMYVRNKIEDWTENIVAKHVRALNLATADKSSKTCRKRAETK